MINTQPGGFVPAAGVQWPDGSGSPMTVADVFGWRPFSAHASGYDRHRGIDVWRNSPGQSAKSPMDGHIIRRNYTQFQFDDDENLSELTEVDPSSKATFARSGSNLVITGKNDGTVAIGSVARMEGNYSAQIQGGSNTASKVMAIFPATFTATGQVVIGFYDSANNEYALLLYDGATFTIKGRDAGGLMGVDSTTAAASVKYMRVSIDDTANTTKFEYSSNGSTWTVIGTEASSTWTSSLATFKAWIGWNPAGAGGDDTINVDFWGFFDQTSIGRFGNWVCLANDSGQFDMMHFRHLSVAAGARVRAGDVIGLVGKTGFDDTSGIVGNTNGDHLHIEYRPNANPTYSNDEPVNPLDASILPRPNGSGNVSAVYSADGTYHILTVTVTRSTQDFDLNYCSLTGNIATRTVDWDARTGQDPADNDNNVYDGHEEIPSAFDDTSASYDIVFKFAKATVGATLVSWIIKDTAGGTLQSG